MKILRQFLKILRQFSEILRRNPKSPPWIPAAARMPAADGPIAFAQPYGMPATWLGIPLCFVAKYGCFGKTLARCREGSTPFACVLLCPLRVPCTAFQAVARDLLVSESFAPGYRDTAFPSVRSIGGLPYSNVQHIKPLYVIIEQKQLQNQHCKLQNSKQESHEYNKTTTGLDRLFK